MLNTSVKGYRGNDLPEDDRIAIQQIYGARDGKQWGPNSGTTSRKPIIRRTTVPTTRPVTKRPYKDKRINDRHNSFDTNYPSRYPEKRHNNPSVATTTSSTTSQPTTKHHKKYYPKPDTCNTSYDAVTIIRGEIFIFKGRHLWRIGNEGLLPGYPHEIIKMWSELPSSLTHIDSVYENKRRQIVFFIGETFSFINYESCSKRNLTIV